MRVEKRATKRVTKRGVAGRPRRAGARARSPRRDADEACPPGVNAPARAAARRALRAARNCRNCRDPIAAVARAETRRKRPLMRAGRRIAGPPRRDRTIGMSACAPPMSCR
ncbi:hypothetical protein AQ745_30610 [Burkholderia pseudomallei]|nr:hypothetical protein AQ743_22165 [Burkholderia pseudomallei]OMS75310.1 hypothetical protein AQ745_30610 [Burkholderia pseudomallei]OMS75911.1 hypothetical protein AQ747_15160 [Burkholderia pseudomallei]